MNNFTAEEIFEIFSFLLGGRRSVYTIHGKTLAGENTYRRACKNKGLYSCLSGCDKCPGHGYVPLSPQAIDFHIKGMGGAGIYPTSEKGLCRFALIELKGDEFKMHLCMLAAVCEEFEISHLCELTDFGKCGRLWIFFKHPISPSQAAVSAGRVIGAAMTLTDALPSCLFSQVLPSVSKRGDLGKPVILPLFAMDKGYSVFVDDKLNPIEDIFNFLKEFPLTDPKPIFVKAGKEDFPKRIDIELCNSIYISTKGMTRRGIGALCALACFPNPEKSGEFLPPKDVFKCCFRFSSGRIHLPLGLMKSVFALVRQGSDVNVYDGRSKGQGTRLRLTRELSPWQERGVECALRCSRGIITAPTGSGKTEIVCGIMERLAASALILTTEKAAAVRWKERLEGLLGLDGEEISCIIGDDACPNGRLDIAVLCRRTELRLSEYLPFYGLVIVADADRLHCGGEIFKTVMDCVCAKNVYCICSKPIEQTLYGDYVRVYCGERIY